LFTASAAAGPALEGQHISCGTLAVPGAISDLEPVDAETHRLLVLDADMQPAAGGVIDLRRVTETDQGNERLAKGITGTGVIAALDQGLEAGIIALPQIRTADHKLHFGNEIYLTESDLSEAGKAIGAIRAGYFTLSVKAGINPVEIEDAYLSGASGTYVDARKSVRLGLIPPSVARVKQVGNTSLAMARELATEPEKLEEMEVLADTLRHNHCMFAKSKTFAKLFLLELSHWTEGMPMALYREMLQRYQLPDLPPPQQEPEIERSVKRDIDDMGRLGLETLEQIGQIAVAQLQGCQGCLTCMESCPTGAISIDKTTQPPTISLTHALCNGVACRRCEPGCEPKVFRLEAFFSNYRREN
jgi:methylamine methyltransferase corrinoid protein reductive activase